MVKVERKGIVKEVDKELAAHYVKAGWNVVSEKKKQEPKQESKPIMSK